MNFVCSSHTLATKYRNLPVLVRSFDCFLFKIPRALIGSRTQDKKPISWHLGTRFSALDAGIFRISSNQVGPRCYRGARVGSMLTGFVTPYTSSLVSHFPISRSGVHSHANGVLPEGEPFFRISLRLVLAKSSPKTEFFLPDAEAKSACYSIRVSAKPSCLRRAARGCVGGAAQGREYTNKF